MRAWTGSCVPCAASVAARPPNGSSNWDSPTITRCAADRDSCRAWQRDELARHVVRDLGEGRRETMLFVEGIRCTACVWLIERALQSLPGVANVQVNALARRARITWFAQHVALSQIL